MTEKELKLAALLHTYDRWNKIALSNFKYKSKGDTLHVKTFCDKYKITNPMGSFCSCCLMSADLEGEYEYLGTCRDCFISEAIEAGIVAKDEQSCCLKSFHIYKDYLLKSRSYVLDDCILAAKICEDIKKIIAWIDKLERKNTSDIAQNLINNNLKLLEIIKDLTFQNSQLLEDINKLGGN